MSIECHYLSNYQIKIRDNGAPTVGNSFSPQALVNMGEILKAAGCGYDNGEENFTV